MADGKVIIDTSVDSKGAVSDINGMESKVKAPLKRIAALMTVAFSIKAITSFAKEAEKLYETQLTQETKLATIMKQRMGANGKQIQQVKDLASEQQQLGVIGDEVQLAGAQQIATFLNEKKSLESLIPAMNNLIAQQYGYNATAESAKNIGNLFGKVMQGQTTALKRVGITFTEAEEKVLKYGNEQQRAAMLSQVITNNVGNMNSALANTPFGQQQQLSNTIGDIKENFGQAFINIKTLFLPALNVLAGIANKASLAFISLSKALASTFGIDLSNNQALASGVQQQSEGADALADGMNDVANSTKKANKQAKAGVRAFDNLVNIQTNKDESSSEKVSSTSGSAKKSSSTVSNVQPLDNTANMVDSIKLKLKELKNSIDNLFGSSKLTTSAKQLASSVIFSLSRIGTSTISIGKSIGMNIFNGAKSYFDQNKDFISDNLSKTFGNISGISINFANLSESIADILVVLRGPEATSITESFIEIFANSKIGVITLLSSIAKDISDLFTKPIVDNTGKIKTAFKGLLTFVEPIMKTLSDAVTNTWTKINDIYDTYISPAFDNFTQAVSDTLGAFLDMWNTYLAPILSEIATEFSSLWSEYIQPVVDNVITFIGKVVDMVSALWSNVLLPFVQWVISNAGPYIAGAIKGIWDILKGFVKNVAQVAKSVIDVFSSIVTFLTDIFKGDWNKAWEDIKGIVKSVVDLIGSIISGFVDSISGVAKGIGDAFDGAWQSIKLAFDLDKVGKFFSDIWSGIKGAFSNVAKWFEDTFSAAWKSVKDVFSTGGEVFLGIKDGIIKGLGNVINKLISGINSVIKVPFDALNKALRTIKDVDILGVKPFDWVEEIAIPKIPSIKLATGAVLPPNKPFLATVGDQKHGTNVEAPLDTIVQAMNIALAKNGNNSGGDIVINIDGNEVFRVVQNKANEFTKRTGLEAFA